MDVSSKTETHGPTNLNGGLTLIPAPGFEQLAEDLKNTIEAKYSDTLIDIVAPIVKTRTQGEPCIQMGKDHIGGHDCVLLTSGPGTLEMIALTQFLLGQIVGRRARRVTLVCGYLPLSRSDRDEGELEFALETHVVHLFKSAAYGKLDRIITVDLHSPQGVQSGGQLGFITEISLARRVLKKVVRDAMNSFPGKNIVLVLPDENSAKRFRDAISRVRQEILDETGLYIHELHGLKDRKDSKDSKFLGLFGEIEALEAIKNSIVIMFDDEIATFKTNYDVAIEITKKYVPSVIWSAVIHGVICSNAPELIANNDSPISKIYLADTIPFHNRPKIHDLLEKSLLVPIEWASDLAQIIYHHHWDRSIREKR